MSDIKVGDKFVSNNGKGPLRAVVTVVEDGWVSYEWWDHRTKLRRRHRNRIQVAYFTSPSCGWKRQEAMRD